MYNLQEKKKRRARKVSIEEEEQIRKKKEYEAKVAAKESLLETEYYKFDQQRRLEQSAYETHEINLKGFLNALITENETKAAELINLTDNLAIIERVECDALGRWTSSKMTSTFQANSPKTTMNRSVSTSLFSSSKPDPEALDERLSNLFDTYEAINRQLEAEEVLQEILQNKIEIMNRDILIYLKRNSNTKAAVEHAEYRFADLHKTEFMAKAKQTEAHNVLVEFMNTVHEVRAKEHGLLHEKIREQAAEETSLKETKVAMSNMLIKLDDNNKLFQDSEKNLNTLENRRREVMTKKSDSKYTNEYIDVLEKLERDYLNLEFEEEGTHQGSEERRMPSRSVQNRPNIKFTHHQYLTPSPTSKYQESSPMSRRATFSVGATNRTSAPEKLQIPDSPSPAHTRGKKHKTHVLADGENFSNYILRKVQGFYQRHEQGPAKLVDSLIKKYQQFLFQESSYKRMYEEMINQKAKKEAEMDVLAKEREVVRKKHVRKRREMAQILATTENYTPRETTFVDSPAKSLGLSSLGFQNSPNNTSFPHSPDRFVHTSNPVIELQDTEERQVGASTDLESAEMIKNELQKKQTFVLKIYTDFLSLLLRFSNLLHVISDQSPNGIPNELERLLFEMIALIKECKAQKSNKPDATMNPHVLPKSEVKFGSVDNSPAPAINLFRFDTHTSITSDLPKEEGGKDSTLVVLPANELKNLYLTIFSDCLEEAEEFAEHIKNDLFISNFLGVEEVREFLSKYKEAGNAAKEEVEDVIFASIRLEEDGIQIFCKKFQKMMDQFLAFYNKLTQNVTELHMAKMQDERLSLSKQFSDVLELGHHDSSQRKKHPLQFSEFVKNSQEKRAKALVIREEQTPKQKKNAEARTVSRGNLTFRDTYSSSLHKNEAKSSLETDQEFKANLARLTFTTLEKRRGFHNRDFPFINKSRIQQEKDVLAHQERNNWTEQEFMENERKMIREQEAAAKESIRRKELGLDKEPVKTPVQITFSRLIQTKPPEDKARMLKNSNLLKQIHMLETSLKDLKAPTLNELVSKEFAKNFEMSKPRHNRARSFHLKTIDESNEDHHIPPVGSIQRVASTHRTNGTLQSLPKSDKKSAGPGRHNSLASINSTTKHLDTPRTERRESDHINKNISVLKTYRHSSMEDLHKISQTPSSTSTRATKDSHSKLLPPVKLKNQKSPFFNPTSLPSSTRSYWKPPEIDSLFTGVYSPNFLSGQVDHDLNLLTANRFTKRQSSLLVEEKSGPLL